MTALVLPHTINQSQLKTWRRCGKEWEFHYKRKLESKFKGRAITVGLWGHRMLETHYLQGDWKIGYNEYLEKYNALFDEEREVLDQKGKLPDIMRRIMRGYLWYYKDEPIKVHVIEKSFEMVYAGVRFKGRIDWLIETTDDGRLWVGDHKWVSSIPEQTDFHAMDVQLMLYPFAITREWGIEIAGVMWNYIRSRPASIPQMTKAGRISRRKIVTDYPTARKFLVDNGFDPRDFSDYLRPLRASSPLLKRYWLPREDHVTAQIMKESVWTGRAINAAMLDPKLITRNITRDCNRCSYLALCRAELEGGDTEYLIKRYYQDVKEDDGYSDFAQYADTEAE